MTFFFTLNKRRRLECKREWIRIKNAYSHWRLYSLSFLFFFFFFELFTSFYKVSQSVSRESIIGTENECLHRRMIDDMWQKDWPFLFLSVVCFFSGSGSGEDRSISGITDSWLGTFDNQFWDWIQFDSYSPMTRIITLLLSSHAFFPFFFSFYFYFFLWLN